MTTTQNAWPPAVQHEIQLKSAINFLLIGLGFITVAGAFVLVPAEPNWRHFTAAVLLIVKGSWLCWNSSRMIRLTVWGKGRRRRA